MTDRFKNILVVSVVFIVFFLLKSFFKILWPAICVVLMISNRDIVLKIINFIKNKIKENKVIGIVLIAAAILLFIPFNIYLLLRTILYIIKTPSEPTGN